MIRTVPAVLLAASLGAHMAATSAPPPALRLYGTVEPLRSHPVVVPRLTGSAAGTLVIVHLIKPGSVVKRGDLLIEFDRQAQVKNAHDREAEYRDFLAQMEKKRGEQLTARAHDEADLTTAEKAVKSAELEMLKNEMSPPITAEQNRLSLEEARAKLQQLRRTFDLKRRSESADLESLAIQRDRAKNAWAHADDNAAKMKVVSPIDGLVVLKTTWKNGTMGEVQEGEEVRAGLPVLEVIDSSAMRVRARVNQADVDRLRLGEPVRITLDSYPSRTFNGRLDQLSRIGATSSLSNRVRTFLALFSIEGNDPHLMPDLGAAIDLDDR